MSRKWIDKELMEERLHDICKNTCQCAKKGDRPNVLCPLCWLNDIYESIDELAAEKTVHITPTVFSLPETQTISTTKELDE